MPRLRCHLIQQIPLLTTCLFLLVTAMLPLEPVRAAVQPALTLEPHHGPCAVPNPLLAVRGAYFSPGQAITLLIRTLPTNSATETATTTVAADGTFAVQVQLFDCGPTTRDGTQYYIYVRPAARGSTEVLASAIFTKSSSPSPPPGLPNTGGGSARIAAAPPRSLLGAGGLVILLGGVLLYAGRVRRWDR